MWGKKNCHVPCTSKWHPINSNRIVLSLAASAGVGHSLNPESSPPSLLKAFSLMTLQRWEEVAAQKGLESKGGIDPGKQPSTGSLPHASPPSSSSSPFVLLLTSPSPRFVNSCFLFLSAHLFKSDSLDSGLAFHSFLSLLFFLPPITNRPPPLALSGFSLSLLCWCVIEGSDVPGLRANSESEPIISSSCKLEWRNKIIYIIWHKKTGVIYSSGFLCNK